MSHTPVNPIPICSIFYAANRVYQMHPKLSIHLNTLLQLFSRFIERLVVIILALLLLRVELS